VTITAEQHQGLVHAEARRFRSFCGRSIDYEDLVQAGNIGLLIAIDRFDPERGCKFSTYARYWIWHHIVREVQNNGRTVRVPVWAYEQARREGVDLPCGTWSLDAPHSGHSDMTLAEVIPSGEISAHDALEAKQRDERVARRVRELEDPRHRRVIRGRFFREQTLQEVGEGEDVSRERIRQLEREALGLLERRLASVAREFL
jgi:RNA polymerase sigma factor (sigma-70 family)